MVLVKDEEPERLKFEDKEALDKLSQTIQDNELGLIVLDVLRELHDGPENESDYMGPLLRPIRQMAHDLNMTIIVSHHHSRNNAS
jgi:RecA-family ATPase